MVATFLYYFNGTSGPGLWSCSDVNGPDNLIGNNSDFCICGGTSGNTIFRYKIDGSWTAIDLSDILKLGTLNKTANGVLRTDGSN